MVARRKKRQMGREVACVCCNHGATARCINCLGGFEQLQYNEENWLYKIFVWCCVLFVFGWYGKVTYKTAARRWRVYGKAPFWVRYSRQLTKIAGEGSTLRQPAVTHTDALSPETIVRYAEATFSSYTPLELVALLGDHCNQTTLRATANGHTNEAEHCGIDASPAYRQGCRAGYYLPKSLHSLIDQGVDVARPCPDGFFCLADTTCYITCPLGASCTRSQFDAKGDCAAWKHTEPLVKPVTTWDWNATSGELESRPRCPGSRFLTLCEPGYYCDAPDAIGQPCSSGHYCPKGSDSKVRCSWYEQCGGRQRVYPNSMLTMALVSGFLVLVALTTSSTWVALELHCRSRRAAQRATEQHEEDWDDDESVMSVEEQKSGWSSKLFRSALSAVWSPATAQDGRSIFRRDAEKVLCCGLSPRSHLRIGLASCSAFTFFLIWLSFSIHDFSGKIWMVSLTGVALFVTAGSSCALCTFQRAAGSPTFSLCTKESLRAMALVGGLLGVFMLIEGTVWLTKKGEDPIHDNNDLITNTVDVKEAPNRLCLPCWFAAVSIAVALWGCFGLCVLRCATTRTRLHQPLLDDDEEDSDHEVVFERGVLQRRDVEQQPTSRQIDFKIDLDFRDLGLRLHSSGLQVLQGVTGSCSAGRVTAIMGPSGAGKTTLLNVLSGRASYGATTGVILVNGLRDTIENYGPFVGFVPQEDIMHPNLTVGETIELYGALRLPRHYSSWDLRQVTAQTLEVLGLEQVENSVIGDAETRGISGGQRKRVNVGMEIVAEPSLLFMDEPTSGLDSTTSLELVLALRKLATTRKTNVIVVLHQPSFSIYQAFHEVLLLCRGGTTAYQGESHNALEYFESIGFKKQAFDNPADFFMDVIAGKIKPTTKRNEEKSEEESAYASAVRRLETVVFEPKRHTAVLDLLWKQHQAQTPFREDSEESSDEEGSSELGLELGRMQQPRDGRMVMEVFSAQMSSIQRRASRLAGRKNQRRSRQVRKMPTALTQFFIFLKRAALQFARDKNQFALDCCIQLVCGAFFGGLYADFAFSEMQTLFFMLSLGVGLTSSLASLRVFGSQRAVFWREAAPGGSGMGLDRAAYFLALNVIELPRLAVFAVLTLATFIPLAHPLASPEELFLLTFSAMFAVSGAAYGLSIAQNPKASQLSTVLLVLVFVLFCGVSPKLRKLDKMGSWATTMAWLSYGRWYVESLYTSQTRRLSDAWKMPWAWYASPLKDCALQGLVLSNYSEVFRRKNKLVTINFLNVPILIAIGVVTRIISFALLLLCNRTKMGKKSLRLILLSSIGNPIQDAYDDLTYYFFSLSSSCSTPTTGVHLRRRSSHRRRRRRRPVAPPEQQNIYTPT